MAAAGLGRVEVRELRRFRLLYPVYPQIRESVTPELFARLEVGTLQSPFKALPQSKRETLSPESEIVETAPSPLVHRLSFSHLAELLDDAHREMWDEEGESETNEVNP